MSREPGLWKAMRDIREAWRDEDFRRFALRHGRGFLGISLVWIILSVSLGIVYAITDWAWAFAGALGLLFGWMLHRAAFELLEHELQKAAGENEEK